MNGGVQDGHGAHVDDRTDLHREDLGGEMVPVRHGIATAALLIVGRPSGSVLIGRLAVSGLLTCESRRSCRGRQRDQEQPPQNVRLTSRLKCVHIDPHAMYCDRG